MSEASIQAYIDAQPKIKPSEEQIMTFLSHGGATLHEVSNSLLMHLQTASARLSELNDKGLVNQGGIMGVYYLTPENEVEMVKAKRERQRFRKWKKLGEKNNYFAMMQAEELDKHFDENGKERKPLQINQQELAF